MNEINEQNQVYKIKQMLEEDAPELAASLSFKTHFEPDEEYFNSNVTKCVVENAQYDHFGCPKNYFVRNKCLPVVKSGNDDTLTHKIICANDKNFEFDGLFKIKKFVPSKKLVYFNIKDCFYRLNSSLLPQNLRQLSLRKINVASNYHRFGYYLISPMRGLISCFDTCNWFSEVVINENPFVSACLIDDIFCSKEDSFEAKKWFTDRGFEINDTSMPNLNLFENIVFSSFQLPTECSICFSSCKFISLACIQCSTCFDCFFEIHRTKPFQNCRSCPECLHPVSLIRMFLSLQKKFKLPSIETLFQAYHTPIYLHPILSKLRQEVHQKFPKFKNIFCFGCKSKDVTAVSDRGVYKCENCRKIYCPTCDIETLPEEVHVCQCPFGRCPQCHVFVEKVDGCNHVVCSLCKCEFMYRSNSFVDNFNIDMDVFNGKITIKPDFTMDEIMGRVAQFPKRKEIILFKSLKLQLN